jgi:hypothetical protein
MFAWAMYSTDSTSYSYDYLYARVYTQANTILAYGYLTNTATRNIWFASSIANIDVTSRRGQTIRLAFDATTDSSYYTTWFVDHVWLTFFCGAGGASVQGYDLPSSDGTSPQPGETVNPH